MHQCCVGVYRDLSVSRCSGATPSGPDPSGKNSNMADGRSQNRTSPVTLGMYRVSSVRGFMSAPPRVARTPSGANEPRADLRLNPCFAMVECHELGMVSPESGITESITKVLAGRGAGESGFFQEAGSPGLILHVPTSPRPLRRD